MRIAVIILNRNLPDVTDSLCQSLIADDLPSEDLYVIEAGSDDDNVSKFCTWHIRDEETKRIGLRYNRGMNQALINLYQARKWSIYDAFLLLTNDTEFTTKNPVEKLGGILSQHSSVAMLTPCSLRWGEKNFISDNNEKYFWSISTTALLLRREFIDAVSNKSALSNRSFLFDGTNFRGYLSDMELIAKAYINDWAVAVTTQVFAEENDSHLINISELIKTESYQENISLYLKEGIEWAQNKYGFQSKWDFVRYSKLYYDEFFRLNPHLLNFKL